MTGRTGILDGVVMLIQYLSPVRDRVTRTAELPRCRRGEIVRTFDHGMGVRTMYRFKARSVTRIAGAKDRFSRCAADHRPANGIVTAGTGIVCQGG